MFSLNLVIIELVILSTLVLCGNPSSGFRFNATCSSSIECIPRETFLRCTKGHCLCAADSEYDYRNAVCRLKVNVKCHISGKPIQYCVRGAYCDPPSFSDGTKITGATTGNCKCYQGETNEEDGTCSGAYSFQRSFGQSSLIVSSFNFGVVFISGCTTLLAFQIS